MTETERRCRVSLVEAMLDWLEAQAPYKGNCHLISYVCHAAVYVDRQCAVLPYVAEIAARPIRSINIRCDALPGAGSS